MTIDIEKLKALCSQATPGPWEGTEGCAVFADGANLIADAFMSGADHPGAQGIPMPWSQPQCQRNAAFIAAARTALPAALDEIERLRSKLCERCRQTCPHNCATPPTVDDIHEMRRERDAALARVAELERERDEARRECTQVNAICNEQWKSIASHIETIAERDSLREQLAAVTKERDEVRAGAALALALDQEQIDSLTATVQRESAWVNERDDVLAHIAGVLHEIARCTTIENARTFAEQARANMAERHAGLWAPGPHDDPADWKPGHWRGAK